MKLIESKAEYLPQASGLEGVYKQIEKCGRTCYKSENKITEDSAKDFVDRMIKSSHTAMLEHGTVYIKLENKPYNTPLDSEYYNTIDKYQKNKYSKVNAIPNFVCKDDIGNDVYTYAYYITTNLRVLVENNWLDDLEYLCKPTEFHEKRYTMKFTCDRGVSHEVVRQREESFAQESQRFCNYLKDKFGMSVTFIQPDWVLKEDQNEFENDIKAVEQLYFKWINKGYKAEQARYFLINGTKTEICVTGFSSDWKYFLDLRYFGMTGKPHPDMFNLMQKAKATMKKAGIWHDIMDKPSKFE